MTTFVPDAAALAARVRPWSRIGVSGFHSTRAPVAQLRALCDTGVTDLTFIAWGGALPLELLLDAGLVRRAVLCFSSLEVFGLAPRFRRAVETGTLELEEWTALGLMKALEAAGERLAFEVIQTPEGSDLAAGFSRPRPSPFGNVAAPTSLVPAVELDTFLLHAQRADTDGNVEITGARGLDHAGIFAAHQVLATVEEVVGAGTLGRRGAFVVPRTFVTAVAHVPGGAWPTSCLPYYPTDFRAYQAFAARAAGDADGWETMAGSPAPEPPPARLTALRAVTAGGDTPAAAARVRAALAAASPSVPPDAPATVDELMICVLARDLSDGSVCSVGSASPLATAAYLLAKRLWAPRMVLMSFNGGYVDVAARPMSLITAELLDDDSAVAHTGGDDTYHWYYQRGLVTHEIVGAAQIDATGATNNVTVTSPSGRTVRLPGQGGMADVANLHANFLLYAPRHSPRQLVEQVHFASARRAWHDPDQRRAYGLQPGRTAVLTNLGQLTYDPTAGRLVLTHVHPGITVDQVRAETGFELPVAPGLAETEPPRPEELAALRRDIDPLGVRRLEFVPAAGRAALIDELLTAEERLIEQAAAPPPATTRNQERR